MNILGPRPLNPDLYSSLLKRFGKVKIANEGQRMIVRTVADAFDMSKTKEMILDSGEQYKVCCPYCNDARYRLYISHMWNTKANSRDQYGKYKGLIFCQNEHCDTYSFEDELKLYMREAPVLTHPHNTFLTIDLTKDVQLPGKCVPLACLPPGHPGLVYIQRRQFDPAELTNKWGVNYCLGAESDKDGFIPGTRIYSNLVKNRIIVPIKRDGIQIGWQARAIDDISYPKYYTMPGLPKSHILFNGDKAKDFKFGVIVEGVFDAFRVGERAVALLGKSMSYAQRMLAIAYWGEGGCCVMLDDDAVEDMAATTNMFSAQAFKWGMFSVTPPEGHDPGSMTNESIWSLISSYARTRNIPIATL
jgi:hypothetical protein